MKTFYIILFNFLILSNVYCSEDDSDDSSNSHSDIDSTEKIKPTWKNCPCVPVYKNAKYDEFTGFYYAKALSPTKGIRCGRVVTRNFDDGIKTIASVSEFQGTSRLEKGATYKISEGQHFTEFNVTRNTNTSAFFVTVLDADYDRDNGYILFHICTLPLPEAQSVLLITRKPEIPDHLIKRSADSDSSDDSSDETSGVIHLDLDLPDFIKDMPLYEIEQDKNCKYF